MNNAIAIVIGAVIIAAAILIPRGGIAFGGS